MHVVIVGCGRIGAQLATELSQKNAVTIVDWIPRAFERLGPAFQGTTVVGNAIDLDVLRAAGADTADLVLALTDGDNRNIMAAQVAHHLGAKHVIARVYDPQRSAIFADLGLETISPAVQSANRLVQMTVGKEE